MEKSITVYWSFVLNTNKLDKAKKMENKLISNFETIVYSKLEKYWKDETCFNLIIKEQYNLKEEMFLNLFLSSKLYNLSANWEMTLSENIILDFSGHTDKLRIDGVVWGSFMIE